MWRLIVGGPRRRRPQLAHGDASAANTDAERAIATAIAKVRDAIEKLRFKVGLAALMGLAGWLDRNGRRSDPAEWRRAQETLVLLLAPFAPHLAEELWARLGGTFSVHQQAWPTYDAAALDTVDIDLVVEVDGHFRDRVKAQTGLDKAGAVKLAMTSKRVRASLAGRTIDRAVHVPDRLVNLVTRRAE